MLILTRSAAESLLIGKSILLIREVLPAVKLVLIEPAHEKEFEFSLEDLPLHPVIQVADALVKLMSIDRTEMTLGIDAPRSVPIVRADLDALRSRLSAARN